MQRESEKQGTARGDHLRKETENLNSGGESAHAERNASTGGAAGSAAAQRPGAARVSPADVARRAELSRHLPPSRFPADRGSLLAYLRNGRAPDSIVEAISALPEGREFQTLGELVRAIGPRAAR